MRFFFITALFLVLTVSLFPVIDATSASNEKLIVVTEYWAPFRIKDDTEKYGFKGIDIDILKGLAQHLNTEIDIVRCPFARALELVKNGYADIIPGIAFTDNRAEFIEYVYPAYFSVGPVFYTQKGRGHMIQEYRDLYECKIGYSINSAYFEPFNSDQKLEKTGISTEEQLVKMVALGRIDVVVGTNPNFAYDIKQYGLKDKLEQTVYIPAEKTAIFFGLSRKHQNSQLKKNIGEYLNTIIDNGVLAKIIQKYQ